MEDEESAGASKLKPCDSAFCITLLNLCYLIALFDLAQSFYFLVQSTVLLTLNVDTYSVLSLFGSVFWILMVLMLLMGLWQSAVRLIICWLIFSVIGIIMDIIYFIWTIYSCEYVHWGELIKFTLLYLGIVVEWLCIYVVYKYCLKIGSVCFNEQPQKRQQPLDDLTEHSQEPRSNIPPKGPKRSRQSRTAENIGNTGSR